MAQNFIQNGEVLQYTLSSGSTIPAGSILGVGGFAGIATVDIAEGETGSVAVAGVWKLPKAAVSITQGATVYFDGDGNITTSASGTTQAGKAFEAAASDDDYAYVKLNA